MYYKCPIGVLYNGIPKSQRLTRYRQQTLYIMERERKVSFQGFLFQSLLYLAPLILPVFVCFGAGDSMRALCILSTCFSTRSWPTYSLGQSVGPVQVSTNTFSYPILWLLPLKHLTESVKVVRPRGSALEGLRCVHHAWPVLWWGQPSFDCIWPGLNTRKSRCFFLSFPIYEKGKWVLHFVTCKMRAEDVRHLRRCLLASILISQPCYKVCYLDHICDSKKEGSPPPRHDP